VLTELRIRNFAIIEALVLPLGAGFNVLSGETGAGKSIIVGALGFLLGERANTDLVRTGSDRATVEGTFEVGDRAEVAALLDERGIEVEEQRVVLKREIAGGGRTRAWINGSTVTATVLGEIGRMLVNLHGQHEAQTLLDGDSQRQILDAFGSAHDAATRARTAHETLAAIRGDIESLSARRADAERRADYLKHVDGEIETARLAEGEEERLEEEGRRLAHADELRTLASGMSSALEGDEQTVLQSLASIQRSMASIIRIDPSLTRLQERFDTAFYALDERARELVGYERPVALDPARLEDVSRRRDLLYRLSKKYGPTVRDVIEMGRRSRAELDLVESGDRDLRELQRRETAARAELADAAQRLTALRAAAAERLGSAVDAVLPDLGMPDGHLTVVLIPRSEPGPNGAEDVEFRITLNVGHHARPLARIASGGELSRVMLALKTILARLDGVPTLIFDEVDAGIGGRVGLQVGDTMRRVAAHHQVFAITHLPQIAARAHHHILVSKGERGGVTTADTRVLEGDERITEVARMLGGDAESSVSRAHARELLESASAPAAASAPAQRTRTRKR
jgi:DNA repair protein RecN (Recombination protein N)